MKRTIFLTIISLTLSGCASLQEFGERHPVMTGIGFAVLAHGIGTVASSHGGGRNPHDVTLPPDPCAKPEACR